MMSEITFNDATAPAASAAPPAPQPITVTAGDLEKLIVGAQEKLAELRAQNFVADNQKTATREIDSVRSAIVSADQTITRFEGLSSAALKKIDSVIETQYTNVGTGLFGAPMTTAAQADSQAAGREYVALRQSLFQHRRSRANLDTRLADLERVQQSK